MRFFAIKKIRLFAIFYQKILTWAQHPHGIYYLSLLSFLESFVLPYPPPDIMLAPMVLKNPKLAYRFAFFCTIFSVIGGIIGYLIGHYALELIMPLIQKMHYADELTQVKHWFNLYGIAIVAIAGFSPIPYKIFTLGAGFMSFALLPFVLVSFLSRGMRFFLLTWLVKKYGCQCDVWLQKHIDILGYVLIVAVILGIFYVNY